MADQANTDKDNYLATINGVQVAGTPEAYKRLRDDTYRFAQLYLGFSAQSKLSDEDKKIQAKATERLINTFQVGTELDGKGQLTNGVNIAGSSNEWSARADLKKSIDNYVVSYREHYPQDAARYDVEVKNAVSYSIQHHAPAPAGQPGVTEKVLGAVIPGANAATPSNQSAQGATMNTTQQVPNKTSPSAVPGSAGVDPDVAGIYTEALREAKAAGAAAPAKKSSGGPAQQPSAARSVGFDPQVQKLQLTMQMLEQPGQNFHHSLVDGRRGEFTNQDIAAFTEANKSELEAFKAKNKIGGDPDVMQLEKFALEKLEKDPNAFRNSKDIAARNNFSEDQLGLIMAGKGVQAQSPAAAPRTPASGAKAAAPVAAAAAAIDSDADPKLREAQAYMRMLGINKDVRNKDGSTGIQVNGKFDAVTQDAINKVRQKAGITDPKLDATLDALKSTVTQKNNPVVIQNMRRVMGSEDAPDHVAAHANVDGQEDQQIHMDPNDSLAMKYTLKANGAEGISLGGDFNAHDADAYAKFIPQTETIPGAAPVANNSGAGVGGPAAALSQPAVPNGVATDPVAAQNPVRAENGDSGYGANERPVGQGYPQQQQPGFLEAQRPIYTGRPLIQTFNPNAAYRAPCAPVAVYQPLIALTSMISGHIGFRDHNTWGSFNLRPRW